MDTKEAWELEINTDGDISVHYGNDSPKSRLLFLFEGTESEIRSMVIDAISNIKVNPDQSREYLIKPFKKTLDEIKEATEKNGLEYIEEGGNVRIRFSESDRCVYFFK